MHTHIIDLDTFEHKKKPSSFWFFRGVAGMATLLIVINLALFCLPSNRVSPGTKIGDIPIGWLTRDEAVKKLRSQLPAVENRQLTLTWQEKNWTKMSHELGESWAVENAVNTTLAPVVEKNLIDRWLLRWDMWLKRSNFPITTQLDTFKTEEWVQGIAKEVDILGERPRFIEKNGRVTLESGKAGQEVIQEEMVKELVTKPEQVNFELLVAPTNPPLSADARIRAEKRQTAWAGKELRFVGEPTDRVLSLTTPHILPLLLLPEGFHAESVENNLRNTLSSWEREPQDAQWKISGDGNKLETFVPDKAGRTLNWPALTSSVIEKLNALEQSSSRSAEIAVAFEEKKPKKTLKELNDLGVEERIGFGVSSYGHSIPNRIFNVGLTASRINLTLVKAGEEFSFNKSAGDISKATGYKTAYVIKDGITQLGDGGGVCQVSTTVFRAALNAGLPITKWKAHSYRVGYYEQNSQPGFDATVYAPSTDFRFLNDTGHALVVTTSADSENQHMVVEIWGKSDGRESTISDYSLGNQRPAPPTLFVDDPTLPRGTRKQIDWSAAGATTKFTYTVKNKDGSERFKRQFVSNFQPWRAVYLVGTL
jgi:vancomycin resistance protein YoaR